MQEGDNEVDVAMAVDTAPVGSVVLLVTLLTSLAYVFDGFDIQVIAFAAPRLLVEWGLTRADLVPVLAAGLVGMGAGAMVFGPAGDRFGRRRALVACLLVIALGSFGSSLATGIGELAAWRLFTGLGLGGALPNATAVMAEFAAARLRGMLVASTVVGVPVGGLAGSALAAAVVPAFGWRAIFQIGAALPAALALVMVFALPESPRYLVTQRHRWGELVRLMNRICGAGTFDGTERWRISGERSERVGIGGLLAPELRRDTLAIWLVFASNLFCVYSLFNWTPTVLTAAGLPLADALRGSLFFNLGGVAGSIGGGWAMARFGSRPVLVVLAILAVAGTLCVGLAPMGPGRPLAAVFALMAVSGIGINGIQVQMYTVAASAYPTPLRATGVGWALGVGRMGGVLSSFSGSVLLGLGAGVAPFFAGVASVLLLTLVAILLLRAHLQPVRAA